MIEAYAVDIFCFEQVKNGVQVLHIVARNRKAQAHLLASRYTVADTAQSELVSAFLAAELVVGRFATVQANAHVAHAHVFQLHCNVRRNAGAVRADGRADSFACRIVRKFKKVGAQQRFTTAKEDYRHLEIGKLVDKRQAFFVRQFVLILDGLGAGVTMHATQVAGFGAIPHHHGATTVNNSVRRFVRMLLVTQLIPVIRGIHQELGNANHERKYRKTPSANRGRSKV